MNEEFNEIKQLLEKLDKAYYFYEKGELDKLNKLLNLHLKDIDWNDSNVYAELNRLNFEFYANMYWKLYYALKCII